MMSGFVIDTAGVFCAVISDQHSDLYIDKDDLMPDLVSDDDTDSEDESPPYRRMNEELSILPAILHAFDPIQLFYEAVSAELDRYLGGPQPIIVYSTHTPQWSDTGDAQYFDMLRQFISSQQGRISDHLPEHITIDTDLSEDQKEERWWTHHWGLVRQDLRAAYPGVSDQVIDGPVHELYRVHHRNTHDRRFSSHRLHSSYVFEDMYPEFDIAYGGEESTLHYEERNRLRQIIFGDSEYEPMGHEISRETLRIFAVRLTRLGIMNFRFRGPGLPGDHDYKIRMVYFDHQEYRDFPQVGSIVAAVAAIPWDDNDPEEVERTHKADRINSEAHEMWAFLHPSLSLRGSSHGEPSRSCRGGRGDDRRDIT